MPSPTVNPRTVARSNKPFRMVSDYDPSGDQPRAIADLERRIASGEQDILLDHHPAQMTPRADVSAIADGRFRG